MGIKYYNHKYFFGYKNYYEHLLLQEELEKVVGLQKTIKEKKDKKAKPAEDQDEDRELSLKELQDELPDDIELEEELLRAHILDRIFWLKKKITNDSFRMFIRTSVCFKDIGLFTTSSNPYSDKYSGNHVAIFECELKVPPMLSIVDHSSFEHFDAYRFNMRKWKLVDIDNYM